MSKVSTIERVLSGLLSIATVIGVAVLVEGRVSSRSKNAGGARIEHIKNWENMSESSKAVISDSLGKVSVVTFTDFECPMCKITDSLLTELEQKNPRLMTRSIVAFPLPGHAHAMKAAVAFECARSQGRARAMHERLYSSTKEFGNAPWHAIAQSSSVPDSARFAECLTSEQGAKRVVAGLELGKSLGITGTPAFVVDGKLYDAAPFNIVEKAILDAGRGPSLTRN